MCGIVGIFRKTGLSAPDHRGLDKALEVLSPRGPDGEGCFSLDNLLLGHKRLAILDPTAGVQPWIDEVSKVVLVYNGEIYNFRALRNRLQQAGHQFTTNCDTEVLLAAYLEWGIDCLHELNGMFAFALYDPRDNRLWLARDRLGVKPLYYHHSENRFAFSSSVAGLLVMPGIEPVLDRSALSHYLLTIRTTFGERTLFRQILTLLPGHLLELDLSNGKLHRRCWWKLPIVPAKEKESRSLDAGLREEVRSRVDRSVSGQLISDVPLGGFLSGGLDSSVLSGSILMNWNKALQACSVGYDRAGYNEWEHVRQAAKFHGVPCREVKLKESDFLPDWRKLVAFKGLPLSTPNEVPIMKLSEVFKESFTVAMSGEGADEIFGGYIGPTFCSFDFDRAGQVPPGLSDTAWHRGYGRARFAGRPEHFLFVNAWLGFEKQRMCFPGLSGEGMSIMEEVADYYSAKFDQLTTCSTFDAYLHVHAEINLEGLLNRLDSSTMAAGVEGRVPYTDHELVEWMFHLPDELKMRLKSDSSARSVRELNSFDLQQAGLVENKRLLRESFDDRVPPSIRERAKMSFPVPFIEWFNGSLKEPYLAGIRESELVKGLLNKELAGILSNGAPVDPMVAWPVMNLVLLESTWGAHL